jgi:hypothetical protein
MDFIVNKTQQIAITADNPDDALKKVMSGEGNPISTNYSAVPRPVQPQIPPIVRPPQAQ